MYFNTYRKTVKRLKYIFGTLDIGSFEIREESLKLHLVL